MTGRRLSARDYKRPRRGTLPIDGTRLRDVAVGLAVGLLIALVVYLVDHRHAHAADELAQPQPSASSPDDVGLTPDPAAVDTPGAAPGDALGGTGVGRYDFYQMLPRGQTLPRFELVEPGREHASQPAPSAQVVRPGIYFLQVGSYRDATSAERARTQLAHLGITANVQRIVDGGEIWHRVRIGPLSELPQLNRLRRQLQSGHLDALVIREDN